MPQGGREGPLWRVLWHSAPVADEILQKASLCDEESEKQVEVRVSSCGVVCEVVSSVGLYSGFVHSSGVTKQSN